MKLLDDTLFNHLVSSLIFARNSSIKTIEDKQDCHLDDVSDQVNRFSLCQQCSHIYSNQFEQFKLKILNLSGCYRLTDAGLK